MIRFERSQAGRYSVLKDGVHVAEIMRYQTAWIAWHVPSNQPVRGWYGLGGSPFPSLRRAKDHIRDLYCHLSPRSLAYGRRIDNGL
jgi:hypothetical protein